MTAYVLTFAALAERSHLRSEEQQVSPPPSKKSAPVFSEGKHGAKAELKYWNDVPVLIVEGTPKEIGTAVGTLCFKKKLAVLNYAADVLKGAKIPVKKVLPGCRILYRNFPDDYKVETEALIRASGAPRSTIILGNTAFDLEKRFGCSALLVEPNQSKTSGALFGRNLDLPSLGYLHTQSLVTIYKPKGKRAFVSVGFPGMVGCLSGMNDAGLCVAVHENHNARQGEDRFNPNGVPFAVCYRKILEECTTISEAVRTLKRLPRTTQTNLSLADRKSVAVLEITPRSVRVRTATNGICACTNHFCTDLASKKKDRISESSSKRFKRLNQARNGKKIGIRQIHQKLKEVAARSKRSQTIQSMIFEPETLKLHLGLGSLPASDQPYKTLELARILKK